MPLITIILFFIFVGLLFILTKVIKNKKKLDQAKIYGVKNFDIELPVTATIQNTGNQNFSQFSSLSDAGAFFRLITPYLGSLNNLKREYLKQHIEDLKNDLKIDKGIYRYFLNEYSKYEGLSDKQVAEKWAEK